MNQTKCRINVASIWLCTAFLLFTVAVNPVRAQFAGGSGTEENPWHVATIDQLQKIGELEYRRGYFIQVANIDASDTKNWNDGKGFKPISFFGSFDGNGYLISNLYINRKDEDNVGLFGILGGIISAGGTGYISRTGVISRIGLDNVDITGRNYVGGLAGEKSMAKVTSSFVTGYVTGERQVGGLVGHFETSCDGSLPPPDKSPDILSSYTRVEVSGTEQVGGVSGSFMQTSFTAIYYGCGWIHDTYASGRVSGDDMAGGWVGIMDDSRFHSSNYWNRSENEDLEAVGFYFFSDMASDIIEGLPADQMTGQNAWIFMHKLDFNQTWQLTEGYPALRWQEPADSLVPPQASILTIDPRDDIHDFEDVEAGSESSREFTLRNKGNIAMSGQVLLEEERSGAFEIVSGSGPFKLDPGSELMVEVVFSPSEVNRYQAVLKIRHDAANETAPVEIRLKGREATYTSVTQQHTNVPSELMLHQNYPNPFNPVTVIEYALPELADVTLQVYDVMGRLVETLVDELKTHGKHQTIWDASDAASGTYIYRLQAGDVVISRKLMLIK